MTRTSSLGGKHSVWAELAAVIICCSQAAALPPPGFEGTVATSAPALGTEGADDTLVSNLLGSEAWPSIARGSNGELYVATESLDENAVHVYRSTNGGDTWALWYTLSDPNPLRRPSLAFANGGIGQRWLHLAVERATGSLTREIWAGRINADEPATKTWVLVDGPLTVEYPSDDIEPRLATDDIADGLDYTVGLTYRRYLVDHYAAHLAVSLDRGASWSVPADLTRGQTTGSSDDPAIAYGLAGWWVAFADCVSQGCGILTTHSATAISWSDPALDAEEWELEELRGASIAVSPTTQGIMLAATSTVCGWGGFCGSGVVYAYSSDGGGAWQYEYGQDLPAPSGTSSWGASLSATDEGFYAAYETDWSDIVAAVAPCAAPTTWTPLDPVNDGYTASGNSGSPTIAVEPTDTEAERTLVAWSDFRAEGSTGMRVYFRGVTLTLVFADDFESGGWSNWSQETP